MSARVVRAINAMALNSEKISSVKASRGGENYFCYKEKYIWSILKNDSDYSLFYYPGAVSTEEQATKDYSDESEYVAYTSQEFSSREAQSSMAELFLIVQEKHYGMDKVLDDIIDDDDLPF